MKLDRENIQSNIQRAILFPKFIDHFSPSYVSGLNFNLAIYLQFIKNFFCVMEQRLYFYFIYHPHD